MSCSGNHEGQMIILRSCEADGTSYMGFKWPTKPGSIIEAPDWDPKPECGNGLHGLKPGQNSPGIWHGGIIQFVEVDPDTIVDLKGKCKFPRCKLLFSGPPEQAWAWAALNAPGPWFNGTATAGVGGTATAGVGGTATAGYEGTATAGYGGTATAGVGGTATAGDRGTATAGDRGTATAGREGIIQIKWWDGKRYRVAVGYIGEDRLKPDTPYKVGSEGKFVEARL